MAANVNSSLPPPKTSIPVTNTNNPVVFMDGACSLLLCPLPIASAHRA